MANQHQQSQCCLTIRLALKYSPKVQLVWWGHPPLLPAGSVHKLALKSRLQLSFFGGGGVEGQHQVTCGILVPYQGLNPGPWQ